jgi:hypothetical protein
MKNTSKYVKLNHDINTISNDIKIINTFIKDIDAKLISNIATTNKFKIIERYKSNSYDNMLIMKAWDKVLNLKYSDDNYNLGLIQILLKQNDLISDLNINNLKQLTKMSKGLEKIARIGEDYFNKPKLIDENKVAHFIRDMLEYITELTIATSLELMIRRILFTYYSNAQGDNSISDINAIIRYILESVWGGRQKSLIDTLKQDIVPELAKNASEIFNNRHDEDVHNNRPTREILLDFFQQMKNYPDQLPDEILNVFNKDVVTYFDTFVSKSIMLWQVNAENIFKYFINNFRCVKTLTEVSNF